MNDYILVSFAFGIGAGYQIMGVIKKLKIQFPTLPPKRVVSTFFYNEWDSLITSSLGYMAIMMALYIKQFNGFHGPKWFEYFGMYVTACILGYAGQRLAYKYLGTAEQALEKKADALAKKWE